MAETITGNPEPVHYVDVNVYDTLRIQRALPEFVKIVMQQHHGLMLGGGFMRAIIAREQVSDIDLFCRPGMLAAVEESLKIAFSHELNCNADTIRVIHSGNATTYLTPIPVQLVHRWEFEDVDALLNHFDFTVCKIAATTEAAPFSMPRMIMRCDPDFYADLAAKRLVYTGSDVPGGSMLRLLKYSRRGYSAPLSTVAKIIDDIATQAHEVASQIPGTNAYRETLRQLVEVDPSMPGINALEN